MRHSNLHTHTVFSDGKQAPEEYVLAAMEKDMVSLGFSDHSYTVFDRSYCMRRENVGPYVDEIRRLQKKYEGRIEIYLGLEYDGFSEEIDRTPYDYLIGGCHYIRVAGRYYPVDDTKEVQRETIENCFGGDADAYAKAYFDACVETTRLHRPDILGHFDLAAKFGLMNETSPVYQKTAAEALLSCLEVTPLMELNTGALARRIRKVPYPADFLLREALAHGGRVILSSDSHDIRHLDACFDDALQLLLSVGFRSIVQMRNHRFVEIGINEEEKA